MTAQETALARLTATLSRLGVPHMLIGGFATIVWGEPRATVDIDVTVWVDDHDIPRIVSALTACSEFASLSKDPIAFIRETRVCPLRGPEGVRIDLIFGMLAFEEAAIRRALPRRVAGVVVPVCTAEDLILHKIVSSRAQDSKDIEGILRRRFAELDLAYLEPRIEELGRDMDDSEISLRWRELSRPHRSGGS